MEAINDKYQYIFVKARSSCTATIYSSCPVLWWYNSCIGNSVIKGNSHVQCPFVKESITIRCKPNGLWNGTELGFFELCHGNSFLFRVDLEFYFGYILYPLTVILYLTSIFKISEFEEVSKDFNWRFILWFMKAKTIKYFMAHFLVIMNSNYVVSRICFSITLLPVFADFFCLACEVAIFLYVYIILYRFDVQIRIIKSSLFRITVMTPILASICSLVLDMNWDDNYNYFECQIDLIESRILTAYIPIYFTVAFILIYLWMVIKNKIKRICELTNTGTYRMEYDIVGARKEIPKREIFRVRYVLNCIVVFSVAESVVFGSQCHRLFIASGTENLFIASAGLASARGLIDIGLVIAIIWRNKHLNERRLALHDWYKEISEEKVSGDDLKSALDDTAEESQEKSANISSSR